MTSAPTPRLPAIFFGHGSPMNTLEQNRYTDAWRQLGAQVGRPKAILAISAHWYTRGTAVTAMDRPKTIHDFYGFPQALFDVQYPAPGDAQLAARVRELLAPVGVALDQSWGLDHGTWSVLKHAFPHAEVPVVQLAIDAAQPASMHFALGAHLAPLRDEGVLIVGSGNVVHNLRTIGWGGEALGAHDIDALLDFKRKAPSSRLAHPRSDHFAPLFITLGAGLDELETQRSVIEGFWFGMAKRSVQIG